MFLLVLGIMNSKINHISYRFKMCTVNKNERGKMDKMAQIISSDNLFETLVFVLSAGS